MAIYYLQFLWGLIAIPVLAYTVGTLTLKGLRFLTKTQGSRPDHLPELFFRLLLGTMVSIVLYALWKKGLNTIMSGFILTAVLGTIGYRWFNRRENESSKNINSFKLDKHSKFIIILFYFLYSAIYFLSSNNGHPVQPFTNINADHGFYAQIGRNLSDGYSENYFPTYTRLEPGKYENTMYHYLEAWGSALISELTGFPAFAALEIFYRAWFLFLALIGLVSLTQFYTNKNINLIQLVFLGALMIGFTSILSTLLIPDRFQSGVHIISTYIRPSFFAKITHLLTISIFIAILWIRKIYILSVVISASLIYVSGGLFVWPIAIIFAIAFSTRIRNRTALVLVGGLLIILIFTYLFFFYRVNSESSIAQESYKFELSSFLEGLKLKEILSEIRQVCISIFQLLLALSPWIFIVLLSVLFRKKSNNKNIAIQIPYTLCAFIILLVFSAVASSMLSKVIPIDNSQILKFSFCLAFIYISIEITRRLVNVYIITACMIVLGFEFNAFVEANTNPIVHNSIKINKSYSEKFILEISQQERHSPIGAFIQDTTDRYDGDIYENYARNFKNFFIHELQGLDNYYGYVSIYDDKIKWDSNSQSDSMVKGSLFYLSYRNQWNNKTLTGDEVRLRFLREYKIDWIVVTPGMRLPDTLNKYVERKICDNNTGFCINYLSAEFFDYSLK